MSHRGRRAGAGAHIDIADLTAAGWIHRETHARIKRWAAADPGNTGWQRDLSPAQAGCSSWLQRRCLTVRDKSIKPAL
jgi:sigma54-dependent transcription regulator